jgi:predicted membrane chloride channel (bestrophin family)
MWILKWLPDWIFYGLLLIGLLGYAVTYLLRFIPIPAIYIYKTPIQIVSIALVVIGTFMSGAIHEQAAWLARVKEIEEKLVIAEQKSEKVNTEVITKYVTKTQVVKEKGEDIIKFVDREVVKYDTKFLPGGECEIPKEVIESINKAAKK